MTLPANLNESWLPLISLKDLKNKPIKRIIAGMPIVVWRANGEILAAKDRCPHRNYPLSKGYIENDNLVCPYHGWEFGKDGDCKNIPGSCQTLDGQKYRLEILKTQIIYDAVFVILNSESEAAYELPPMPQENKFDFFWWELEAVDARVFDALDNVLDPFHTNFIHDGFIRVKNKRQKVTQYIECYKKSFKATYIQDADYGAMSRFLEGKREKSEGQYYPPIAFQGRWEGPKGLNLAVTSWFIPEENGKMRSMVRFAMAKHKGPRWFKIAMIKSFLFKVIEQDADALKDIDKNIKNFGNPKFKAGPDDRLSNMLARLYNGQRLKPEKLGPFDLLL